MRNFEERKAEIFRRSKDRIQERKKTQKRIWSLCVPLCLVLTICSIMMIPQMRPVGTDTMPGENDAMPGDTGSSEAIPENTGKGAIYSAQIEALYTAGLTQEPYVLYDGVGQMYSLLESAVETDRGDSVDGNKPETSYGDAFLSGVIGYRITFLASDGAEEVYTLKGKTLTKHTTGKSVTLTETQRDEILALLNN